MKSVVVAARLGSIGKAAKAMNITQPAISRRIAAAEAAVGVALLERRSRGVVATEAGRAFLRYAEAALANFDDAKDAARSAKSAQILDISLGVVDALCDGELVRACAKASEDYTGTRIHFATSTTSAGVSDNVLAGRTRLGLRVGLDPGPHFENVFVRDDTAIVACAPSHPLAATGKASIEQLEKAQWLGFPLANIPVSGSYNEYLAMRGLTDQKAMPVDSLYARINVLEGGFGVARIRRACIAEQLRTGRLVEIDTPIPPIAPVFMIWRRDTYLDEPTERVRDRIIALLQSQA